MENLITVYPTISHELLTNPGIGFIAAPPLTEENIHLLQDDEKLAEKYKFTPDSLTYNHPDSKIMFCSARWNEIETEKGVYHWNCLEDRLQKAYELGCTAVVRCSPYALGDNDDIPSWFRAECPEEPDFPFWRIDPIDSPYFSYWSAFIRAFAAHFDGNPLIHSVDMALVGAWGEGGGTEFLSEEAIAILSNAYLDCFKRTPLLALLHDPKSLKVIRARKVPVGFRVDCLGDMGGFHGTEWSHMQDFYPQNIQNFGMANAWEKSPVVFEACWDMNDWYRQGWNIDYIIDESLKWHISSYNGKAAPVPLAWKAPVERWLKKMGYRFELHKFTFPRQVISGESLIISSLIENVGVAPIYMNYPLVLRLRNDTAIYCFTSKTDLRSWLPEMDILWEESFLISDEVKTGEYTLEIGIETGLREIGNIKLAIHGEINGYYPMGQINIL
ncbi:DUF4832 domain-containing protein [Scatolibacter rhodanostii]|uniref:DUF4832 domain-containing protein n=1 Tax=Scatolibacter rhodanostii TaxID=2014781 RepID=UPI000C06D6A6|nr:DUF4832 domain-containing protein [Scatolibacter rhodanostii]